MTGSPVQVLPSLRVFSGGAVQLAVSENGTLVHAVSNGAVNLGGERLTWIDMDGTRTHLSLEVASGQVEAPRISPDGTRVAYTDDPTKAVSVYNLSTGFRTSVTEVDPTAAFMPVWSLDGSSLYVTSSTPPMTSWRVSADGAGSPERLGPALGPFVDVSPDESRIVIEDWSGSGQPNLYVARLDTDSIAPEPYLRADWHEEGAVVSPDGNWLAYLANEGGGHDVWLRSFPEPGDAIRVSTDGGEEPVWEPNGSAIYYTRGPSMMRREVRLGDPVELGEETALFSVAGTQTSTNMRMYDIHPDGDRFLFITFADLEDEAEPAEQVPGIGRVVVVLNWFDELRERMGED